MTQPSGIALFANGNPSQLAEVPAVYSALAFDQAGNPLVRRGTVNEKIVTDAELAAGLATITDLLNNIRPVVLTQPTAASGNVGDSLSLSCLGGILPNTHLNLTYQWEFLPIDGVEYDNITGATNPTLPFTPVLFNSAGRYRCRLTNEFGVQYTDEVDLTLTGEDWAALFSALSLGQGYVYDMARMDTMWQDHLQTDPVTDYGQPVGYQLDVSGNGNHRHQTDVAKRGIYGRHPASGIRNLLQHTDNFANAYWVKTNTAPGLAPVVTANAGTAPDGTNTADRVVFNANGTLASHRSTLRSTNFAAPPSTRTVSVWLKSNTGTPQTVRLSIFGSNVVEFIATNEWQRFSTTWTSVNPNTINLQLETIIAGQADVLVWGAQMEFAAEPSTYQRVGATRWDITEVGSPDCFFLAYDGINDGMQTIGTVDSTASDELTCIVAQRKESDAAAGTLVEFSANAASNNGSFRLTAPDGAAGNNYGFRSAGTSGVDVLAASHPAIDRAIITGLAKIGTPLAEIRRNGTVRATSSGSQGTGNFGNHRLNFGAQDNAASRFYIGREYFNFCAFKLLDPEVLDQVEQFAGTKAGISW